MKDFCNEIYTLERNAWSQTPSSGFCCIVRTFYLHHVLLCAVKRHVRILGIGKVALVPLREDSIRTCLVAVEEDWLIVVGNMVLFGGCHDIDSTMLLGGKMA